MYFPKPVLKTVISIVGIAAIVFSLILKEFRLVVCSL